MLPLEAAPHLASATEPATLPAKRHTVRCLHHAKLSLAHATTHGMVEAVMVCGLTAGVSQTTS